MLPEIKNKDVFDSLEDGAIREGIAFDKDKLTL